MGNTNTNWVEMSDVGIIAAIGSFIRHTRLARNKTQEQLASAAGLNRTTIVQIENGESITLFTLIQILRALDQLHVFKEFKFSDEISPLEYAKLKKSRRERARSKKDQNNPKAEDLGW
jgi:transcriptional regulator with XRE-family HTH domain